MPEEEEEEEAKQEDQGRGAKLPKRSSMTKNRAVA